MKIPSYIQQLQRERGTAEGMIQSSCFGKNSQYLAGFNANIRHSIKFDTLGSGYK